MLFGRLYFELDQLALLRSSSFFNLLRFLLVNVGTDKLYLYYAVLLHLPFRSNPLFIYFSKKDIKFIKPCFFDFFKG